MYEGIGKKCCPSCGHILSDSGFCLDKECTMDKLADPLDRLDIREKLSDGDTEALTDITKFCYILQMRRPGFRAVEVGSWKGWSTQVIARLIKKGGGGDLYAVDNWKGSEGDWNWQVAKEHDIFSIFRHNMTELGLQDIVHPMMMDSMKAAEIFEYDSADMIFIDANHRYKRVSDDIYYWLKKLRPGGVICGHDCEGYYLDYPVETRKIIDDNPNTDVIKGIGHPGVIKAVHDKLYGNYKIMPNSRIWYHIKA